MEELINKTSQERLEICKTCEFNSTPGKVTVYSRCKACGCPLIQKSKCLSCNCGIHTYNELHPGNPIPVKWTALITGEEEMELDVKLNEENEKDKGL